MGFGDPIWGEGTPNVGYGVVGPQMWGEGTPNVGYGVWGCIAEGEEDDLEGYPKSVPGRRRVCRVRAGTPKCGAGPQCGVGDPNMGWDPKSVG